MKKETTKDAGKAVMQAPGKSKRERANTAARVNSQFASWIYFEIQRLISEEIGAGTPEHPLLRSTSPEPGYHGPSVASNLRPLEHFAIRYERCDERIKCPNVFSVSYWPPCLAASCCSANSRSQRTGPPRKIIKT